MLKSFFEALEKPVEIKNLKNLKVTPEFYTDNRKRIDLVIEADDFIIGIENKVEHYLNNPLEDYSDKIDVVANGRKKLKVVLSKYHCPEVYGFVNLTYDSFVKSIKKNLPDYETKASLVYLTFLEDFLKNIENTIKYKAMIENKESLKYFQNSYEAIEELTSKFKATKEEACDKFKEIHNVIDPTKLEASMKVKYETEVKIDKSTDIEWVDDIIAFWIFINTPEGNIKIEIAIYSLYICCSAQSICEIYQNRINEFENSKIEIDIAKDTKNVADIILNFIREIGDKAFSN